MSQEWKVPGAGDDDVQMPLGVSGDAAPEADYSAPKFRINTSTVALVAAFAAALVVLYFLGLQNKPRPASADQLAKEMQAQAKIEDWIKNTTGQRQITDFGDSLISLLKRYFDRQGADPFASGDLNDNPFQPEMKPEPVVVSADPGHKEPIIEMHPGTPIDPELLAAAQEFAGLRLQMTMVGNPSSALINSQMVNVGSHFKYLTVKDIRSDRVILGFKEKEFELTTNGPRMGVKP